MKNNQFSLAYGLDWPPASLPLRIVDTSVIADGYATREAFLDEFGNWVELRNGNELLGATALASSNEGLIVERVD